MNLGAVARAWGVCLKTVRRKFAEGGEFVRDYRSDNGDEGRLVSVQGFDVLELRALNGRTHRYMRREQVKVAS